jgi:c-di-GMP-binding flagellar brake protein YcgR
LPGNRAIARDISLTGLRIEGGGVSAKVDTVSRLEKGEVFEVALDLDLINRSLTTNVEVVWIKFAYGKNEFEAGLRFVSLSEQDKGVVDQYLKVIKQTLERFL